MLQQSVLIAQRPCPRPPVVHHDDDKAALHDTAAVLVTLHDKGEVPDVPEALMDALTVGSDRPTTLPPTSLTTMTTKHLFMTPLPSSTPSTTKAKYRTSLRLLQML